MARNSLVAESRRQQSAYNPRGLVPTPQSSVAQVSPPSKEATKKVESRSIGYSLCIHIISCGIFGYIKLSNGIQFIILLYPLKCDFKHNIAVVPVECTRQFSNLDRLEDKEMNILVCSILQPPP